MRDLYQAFEESRKLNKKRGFTLIELLVVIAIIAILAAIAIPQFAKYRVRAYNGAAESDLRNIRTSLEALYADCQTYGDNGTYTSTTNATITINYTCGGTANSTTIQLSNNVLAQINSGSTHYTAATAHRSGDREFCADSDVSKIYWKKATTSPITSVTAPATNYNQNDCIGTFPNSL